MPGTERAKWVSDLTSPYFSHSSHCKVSHTRCLPIQYAWIP